MAFHGNGANINITTDVSAGTYGDGNNIPTITIDGDGRLDAIGTASVTYSTLNANANVGSVGSYAFMQQASGNTQYAPGDTLAGSSLRYSDATGRVHNDTPSGNWRCMGYDSGAALTNSGTGNGTASASANFSGGNVQGDVTGNIQGNPTTDLSLSSGNVQGNTNVNISGNIQGGKTFSLIQATPRTTFGSDDTFSGSATVSTDTLGVEGQIATDDLTITGTTGTIATDDLSVAGNVSVNVNLGTITVNTTVAYSSTLWLRYS
tara:strand:- start:868 stop:1656 length:789 start_codon:yes stop_codon:yes gene_type:complete